MKIFIGDSDTVSIKNNCVEVIIENREYDFDKPEIEVTVQKKKYTFDKSEIREILMLTRDSGPFSDDVCLAIIINNSFSEEVTVFIESEHPLFEKFLFDELKEIVGLDYESVIQAMTCVENKVFPLYKRNS